MARHNATIPPAWETSHEWIRWLSGTDAQVLLLWLVHQLDQEDITLAAIRSVVHTWRRNALQAPFAETWTAEVDGHLEVHVDARLALLAAGPRSSPGAYSI
jgi:hypothetical protein